MIEKRRKDYIKKRANEIIDDYLYDEEETYCSITFRFEKLNGEHQEKVLIAGCPSENAEIEGDDKERLLRHIAKSDLTAVEKRYLMELVRAAGAQERFHRHIMQRFERKE